MNATDYNKFNTSFSNRVVFHLGCDGGFFSEYNNMILAMIHCLRNRIRFTLYFKDANFGYKDGWTDYFLPFCPEENNPLHQFFNMRFPHKYRLFIWMMNIFRNSLKNTLLTPEVFNSAREVDIQEIIQLPELQLEGNIKDICRELIAMTWRYNISTTQSVKSWTDSLQLPDQYIGFHIRGGDKFIEAQFQSADKYIRKAKELSNLRNAFVLTDDYAIIENLRRDYVDWNFYTLCGEDERGYFHQQFKNKNKQYKADRLIKLFASMDILAESEYFIGTFSSNPGMYLGMRMKTGKAFSVDVPEWVIW